MTHRQKLIPMTLSLLLSMVLCTGGALASEAPPEEMPTATETTEATPLEIVPAPNVVYPAEVRSREENGALYLEKVYYLTAQDDPAAIPTADFDREGRSYTLLDILKSDQTETDTKDYIEVVTLSSETKDMAEIIRTLAPELEVTTEDGYTGTLTPDYTNITVEAAGYKTSKWTVSAQRTYPNLSDADISLIPKTTEDSGRTLTLADVEWQDAATDYADGYELPLRYTAIATYTGTATGKYATGYTVTVDYSGEVTKTSCDTVIYTAVFASQGETHSEGVLAAMDEPGSDSAQSVGKLLLIPAGLLLLGGAGYGGYKGVKYYKDKKRGYVK